MTKKVQIDLHKGDCLTVMRLMASSSIDLILTSPPYNLSVSKGREGRSVKRNNLARGKWKNAALANGYASYSDALPYAEYVTWQKEFLTEAWRLLSDDGAIFYQHKPRVQGGTLQTPLDLVPEELRCSVRQIVIWNRKNGFNFSRSHYLPCHEWIVIIAKPKWKKLPGKSGIKDVWTVSPEIANDHPAPFPVELPQIAISTTSARTVLDPFLGSGSTGVAAVREGRNFIGIELDGGYLSKAADRIMAAAEFGSSICIHERRDAANDTFDEHDETTEIAA